VAFELSFAKTAFTSIAVLVKLARPYTGPLDLSFADRGAIIASGKFCESAMNQHSANMTVIRPGDPDAAEIGRVYRLARESLVGSLLYAFECGQKLTVKRANLKHGEWLPWLKENADALGFDTDRTARRFIRFAANRTLTSDLDEAAAVQENRELWGNNVRGTQGTCGDIAVAQLTGAMSRVAKFCKANDAKVVAEIIRPEEIAELQGHAREIGAWLDRFSVHRR
jgi:hypothetical protein